MCKNITLPQTSFAGGNNSDSLLAPIGRQSTGVFHYVRIYMHFEPSHDKLKVHPPALEHILALVDDIVAEYASDFQMIINLKQECIPVGCVPSASVAVCWGVWVSA